MKILELMWQGFWQGVGVEITFLVMFLVWLLFYKKYAPKWDADHFFHRIHDYFIK